MYNDWKCQSESSSYNDVNTSALTYGSRIEHRASAAECIGCKQCERVCPQHLPIAKLLKKKMMGSFALAWTVVFLWQSFLNDIANPPAMRRRIE